MVIFKKCTNSPTHTLNTLKMLFIILLIAFCNVVTMGVFIVSANGA